MDEQTDQLALPTLPAVLAAEPTASVATTSSARPLAPQASTTVARPRAIRFARWVFCLVLVVNVVAGGTVWIAHAGAEASHAQSDLQRQLATMQTLLADPALAQPATLARLSSASASARGDLSMLLDALPFGGNLSTGPWATTARTLRLGIAVADTAEGAVAAAMDLEPALFGLRTSVFQGRATVAADNAHLLNLDDIHAAQRALRSATAAWQVAQATRASVSPADIASMSASVPAMGPWVQLLDRWAPSITLGLSAASAVLDSSPLLLGLDQPESTLLVEMNPDVLRPTGGIIQDYGLLSFSGGELAASVQLHSVASLECRQAGCPSAALPSPVIWYPLSDAPVELSGANLDPELPVAGYVIQRDFQQEGGSQVDGVIAFTPTLFADILHAIGPVRVPGLPGTFSANNVVERLRFYRLDPQALATALGQVGTQGSGAALDANALVVQAIMRALPTLTADQRAALGQALFQAVAQRDLELYSENERVEQALVGMGAAGHVAVPPGDSLQIVDTNIDGTPINPYVRETVHDTVALDETGGAQHALTLSYSLVGEQANIAAVAPDLRYRDVLRVIVPNAANDLTLAGPCTPVPMSQEYHGVLACQLVLSPGVPVIVHASWYVPAIYTPPPAPLPATGSPPKDYTLLVQRQAGNEVDVSVAVSAPIEYLFARAAPPGRLVNGRLVWTASPLNGDTLLSVSFL